MNIWMINFGIVSWMGELNWTTSYVVFTKHNSSIQQLFLVKSDTWIKPKGPGNFSSYPEQNGSCCQLLFCISTKEYA